MASKIVLDGYTLPEGVWVKTDVQDMALAGRRLRALGLRAVAASIRSCRRWDLGA